MSILSVVCNGNSLHLDSSLSKATSPSLLWLQHIDEEPNSNVGGWSFLEALANPSHTQNENVYVHPLAKRSASTMNTNSLNMCTESLGSETGESCCMDECSASPFLLEKHKYQQGFSKSGLKKMKGKGSFPPPLTSISRLEGVQVQVRPFREEGRLVIKAVNITTPASYFHTHRSNGRLTLSLRKPEHLETQEEEEEAEKVVTQI
ncbi:protein FANTASTIC FOUR 1-like [Ipomoea triloba]|uniref:protein FANTASTIC FOUR 1-like n=1 Tax=Ipomoea triloba TaxID=35885 RepID=UPI00125D697E|nr:protein FANTASTIC FOUR 1-like [Ipomoea triloba]